MTPNPDLTERPVTRRWVLGGLSASALLLAGCGTDAITSSTTTTTTAATLTGTATAGTVAALARRFAATLDADQRSATVLDYSLTNAARWSNLPQALMGGGPGGGSSSGRLGISIGELTGKQRTALRKLLKAATGTREGTGYDALRQHLNADDYLQAHGGGDTYGRENYYVAILGNPADSGTWELQFGGHHLAVANTYVDGTLAGATPSFRGIEPNAAFTLNGVRNQPMRAKEKALTAMLASLSTAQLAQARLSDVYSDLVLGPGQDWAFPTEREGLKVSSLSASQRTRVLAAIGSYVHDVADKDAARIMKRYRHQLGRTFIAYSGTAALTERNDYVRIDGPSVWIEFSMQNGIVLSGNHPHSVWRDRTTDYGGTGS